MFDEIKKAFPTLMITMATTLVTIAAGWATLSSRVDAQEKRLQHIVYQSEFKAVITGQDKIMSEIDKRFSRLESRVERLLEK